MTKAGGLCHPPTRGLNGDGSLAFDWLHVGRSCACESLKDRRAGVACPRNAPQPPPLIARGVVRPMRLRVRVHANGPPEEGTWPGCHTAWWWLVVGDCCVLSLLHFGMHVLTPSSYPSVPAGPSTIVCNCPRQMPTQPPLPHPPPPRASHRTRSAIVILSRCCLHSAADDVHKEVHKGYRVKVEGKLDYYQYKGSHYVKVPVRTLSEYPVADALWACGPGPCGLRRRASQLSP